MSARFKVWGLGFWIGKHDERKKKKKKGAVVQLIRGSVSGCIVVPIVETRIRFGFLGGNNDKYCFAYLRSKP